MQGSSHVTYPGLQAFSFAGTYCQRGPGYVTALAMFGSCMKWKSQITVLSSCLDPSDESERFIILHVRGTPFPETIVVLNEVSDL